MIPELSTIEIYNQILGVLMIGMLVGYDNPDLLRSTSYCFIKYAQRFN